MAKRTHFIEKDFETFFTDTNWEKILKSKVDYTQTKKFKDKYRTVDCTFLSGLISYAILSLKGREKFDEIFNTLDNKSYNYSDKDLVLPLTLSSNISSEEVDEIIQLFKLYESKGIELKKNKESINTSFSRLHHYKLDQYKLENDLVTDEHLKHINFHYLHAIKQYNDYKQSGVLKYISKQEREIEKINYENAIKFIKEIITSPLVSTEILQHILNDIPTDNDLFETFIQKNKLEISVFSEGQYFNAVKLKPKEVFTSEFIEIIELLEKKLGITYLDNTGKNPKEVFEETLKQSDNDFNGILSLQYKDGTSIELNTKRKFK